MPSPLRSSDLPAGLAAVAALVLTMIIPLPFWLSLLVAILVYAGIALLLRRPEEAGPAVVPLAEQVGALEKAGQAVKFPNIFAQIEVIATQARAIMAYLKQHPDDEAQWQEYLQQCLATALTGTLQFGELAPHLSGPADPATVTFGEFLQTLAETLKGVYSQLIAADAADFSASIHTYKNTLHEINQMYLSQNSISQNSISQNDLGGGKP